MNFRMKKTWYTGFSKVGRYQEDHEPLPGCKNYEERLRFYHERHTLSDEQCKGRIAKLKEGRTSNASPAISLLLRHGDIVVMHGADIQKYYEVSYRGRICSPMLTASTACSPAVRQTSLCSYEQICLSGSGFGKPMVERRLYRR